ncbi:uncharacterized protein Z518_08193 [Rhinocladiella mackenziei CBS 650.93]|uniref:glycerol-3-phosphate dehydrogenase n=1 Tax=Rhinocladiella mackenziei CBS 650.93 TaxID=1442369 RepID=A0A0D2I8T5_9EURO|nr:uncharacterized protein Z518_08193 [Rhinocladiella mackenziei CBS 650.93]KIX02254.1 hypothetical protein Z518_08193 [Rhinocladiella mackenziei CBS 650.93]
MVAPSYRDLLKRLAAVTIPSAAGVALYSNWPSSHRNVPPFRLASISGEDQIVPPTFGPGISREDQLRRLRSDGSHKSNGENSPRFASIPIDSTTPVQKSGKPATNDEESDPEDVPKQSVNEFDILVIGAGATGSGIALDAASRGLMVALVDRDDFAGATSSKSTKLVHGGVRYLEKAVWQLDYTQYNLVQEALHERATFLHIAPHLTTWLPVMLPIDRWWKLPYYGAGIKMYDVLAGSQNAPRSYFLNKGKALEAFPMIQPEKLVGALVYYDGSHNDSRTNISLGVTAAAYGATVANYVEVADLVKDDHGKLIGAGARDLIARKNGEPSERFLIKAKAIVNATGPFSDAIRKMDDKNSEDIVSPSAGTHVILPDYYSPDRMGLIDPETPDGRVLFFLPWLGNTIAGTTESSCTVSQNPDPSEKEIQWILSQIQEYLSDTVKVRRGDVLAAWSGIRPLVRDLRAKDTQSLARSHSILVSNSGLVTCAGGKWTTYRQMAQETVDEVIKQFHLTPRGLPKKPQISGSQGIQDDAHLDGTCQTRRLQLIGSHGFSQMLFISLIQHFDIETDVAKHLAESYGDRSWTVAALCSPTQELFPVRGIRLSRLYPFVDGEVRYAVRYESAQTAIDILARRTRLSFLNAQAALGALPLVIDIMAEELGWSRARKDLEWADCVSLLGSFGLPHSKLGSSRQDVVRSEAPSVPHEFDLYARHGKNVIVFPWTTKCTDESSGRYRPASSHVENRDRVIKCDARSRLTQAERGMALSFGKQCPTSSLLLHVS